MSSPVIGCERWRLPAVGEVVVDAPLTVAGVASGGGETGGDAVPTAETTIVRTGGSHRWGATMTRPDVAAVPRSSEVALLALAAAAKERLMLATNARSALAVSYGRGPAVMDDWGRNVITVGGEDGGRPTVAEACVGDGPTGSGNAT